MDGKLGDIKEYHLCRNLCRNIICVFICVGMIIVVMALKNKYLVMQTIVITGKMT